MLQERTMIDLRSDTFTRPSQAMRKAMAEAEVGDDVSREDPTLNRLEKTAAERLGKEAALFVPSGTFGNQLALFTLAERGSEVYLSENCHIIQHEAGASAFISGTFLRTIQPENPWLTWEEIEPRIRRERDQHFPLPGLIEVENALGSGQVYPLEELRKISRGAGELDLPVHMDGARLFNASIASGTTPADICANADTVMFCLSKGLGAPVGSLLCGTKEVIEAARLKRKIMGGGMRQAGILGAAGLVALEESLPLLKEDHQRAKELARVISKLPSFQCDPQASEINMVFMKLKNNTTDKQQQFLQTLKEKGILTYPPEQGEFRFVFHRDISDKDFQSLIKIIKEMGEDWS